jgi:hypothetical protein
MRSQDASMPKDPPPEEENNDAVEKIDLKALMSQEEFQTFGLNKLSDGELQLLNAWLSMNQGKLFPGNKPG